MDERKGESRVAPGRKKESESAAPAASAPSTTTTTSTSTSPTHPPVRLIVSDDCLRIMAETHNSDYNACSSNNAVTSRSVVYVNVPARAPRRRVCVVSSEFLFLPPPFFATPAVFLTHATRFFVSLFAARSPTYALVRFNWH